MSTHQPDITPTGEIVAPGALWEHHPWELPAFAIEVRVASISPHTYVGRVLGAGHVLAETDPQQSVPDALQGAEGIVTAAVLRLFAPAA